MDFFIIYVSLSILKILRKLETWSPEPVRCAMEHAIHTLFKFSLYFKNLWYFNNFQERILGYCKVIIASYVRAVCMQNSQRWIIIVFRICKKGLDDCKMCFSAFSMFRQVSLRTEKPQFSICRYFITGLVQQFVQRWFVPLLYCKLLFKTSPFIETVETVRGHMQYDFR